MYQGLTRRIKCRIHYVRNYLQRREGGDDTVDFEYLRYILKKKSIMYSIKYRVDLIRNHLQRRDGGDEKVDFEDLWYIF